VDHTLFGSELWTPALDKYADATGLSVQLFGVDEQIVLSLTHPAPLVALFRECGHDPGLFAECARRCLKQTHARPVLFADGRHGLTVVGTSLVLEGAIVGAAVAGYALAGFSQVGAVQRWAKSIRVPFARLWDIVRRQPPVPERRLILHGELLQVLGDALLRENYRTRQYKDAVTKLEAANAAKDEFLAVVSHELRTPLAPIAGWASLMRNAVNLAQVHQAADAIERNAFLQSRMVDDLLDMNRVARGTLNLDFEILELRTVLGEAVDTIAEEIEKKSLQLEIDAAEAPLPVEGDAGRLQQVFGNILSNAVKFTPAGGAIHVTLAQVTGNALVSIADTGKGIAPEFLPFVFEMFRQQEQGMRRDHQGLGIGMALVKRLTELHKGTVSVASAGAGRGTEVTVRLPLAVQIPELEELEEPAEPSASALAGLSILVVDDSDDTRESLQAILQGLGARVSAARDGREALDLMHDADLDLVLCDLRMPRMDGFEFMRELHHGAHHPPVVAVSLEGEPDRRRTREVGFEGHIGKPLDVPGLVAAIEAALAGRKERRLAAS